MLVCTFVCTVMCILIVIFMNVTILFIDISHTAKETAYQENVNTVVNEGTEAIRMLRIAGNV